VKKLFLVFLVLLVGMAGLPAAPPGEGGVNDTPQVVIPQADDAFTRAVDLICLWSDQYWQGLLTRDEFKVLVAGRIVIAAHDYSATSRLKTDTNGMRSLAEKTKQKVDRLFMSRELQLGIHGPTSLAPDEFPILC
jgi:hypothetical protein